MKRLWPTFCLLCLLLWGLALPHAAEAVERMDYDELMEFVLDSQGTVTVVNFWATWCGPCIRELPGLAELRRDIPREDMTLVGVSLDFDPAQLERFLQTNEFNYPIYIAGPDLMRLMRIKSIPKILIYDCQGLEVLSHEGYLPAQELREMVLELLEDRSPCP